MGRNKEEEKKMTTFVKVTFVIYPSKPVYFGIK